MRLQFEHQEYMKSETNIFCKAKSYTHLNYIVQTIKQTVVFEVDYCETL